jgi:nucleotide-binding universal stress UspA family protein
MKQSLTQLLVHLDASPQAASRLKTARSIARAQGARVTALFAVTPSMVEVPFAPEAGASVAATLRDVDDERRAKARGLVEQSVAAGEDPLEWAELLQIPIAAGFAQQALYADLMVLGQHDPSAGAWSGVPFDFVETVLAASGKAALVLPYTGETAAIGETVVIAWKPTRESARAVEAAIPLLQRARRVHVLSWAGDEEAVGGQRLDLDGYLKRHGVEFIWHREGESEPDFLGELLLSRAFDLEADLLVMGCYGHSRAREWVLGGTSRTVLRSMTMPVLMAH